MRAVFFSSLGIVAIIEDAPGGGAASDPDAPRNRPAIDPGNWIDKVRLHSACNYYRLAAPVQSVSVSHDSLDTETFGGKVCDGWTITAYGKKSETDILLYAHNLGVVPSYMISYAGARLLSGQYIQIDGTGFSTRTRFVSHYATDTGIYLHEVAITSDTALDAMDATYEVMVFDRPEADPDLPLASYTNSSGLVQLGRGLIRSDALLLRGALPAESSFDFNLGSTGDLNNGAIRNVTGGVTYTEPGYAGSFTGPDFRAVGGIF